VVVPGGIGTVLERAMICQLLPVRKLDQNPLILIGPVWSEFLAGAQVFAPASVRKPGGISDCVATPQDAIAIIRPHYDEWLPESNGTVQQIKCC
jgi:hypothetical protein